MASATALFVIVISLTTAIYAQQESQPLIWPLPAEYEVNETQLFNISVDFNFNTNIENDILSSAFSRYQSIMFPHSPRTMNPSNALSILNITVASSSDYLQISTDESYNLTIKSSSLAILTANTIYGVLRGIETFSQTVIYNFDLGYYQTYFISIIDYPRFKHRGILLDCSRHYHSINGLERLLDSMSYSKFNVFHWHLTDDQSIPYESVVYPLFWNDSWSKYEKYSQQDMQYIVQYAKYRGIRVIPEIEMPGHATSWCIGYPLTCPFYSTNGIDPKTNHTCRYPLNPAVNFTFQFIDNLIGEMYNPSNPIFIDDFIHLGGDEVNPYCWTEDPTIIEWMKSNKYSTSDAIKYFITQVEDIATSYNKTVIQWDDSYFYGASKKTFIEAYYNIPVATSVKAGYKSLASEESNWYLDHLDLNWETFYSYEPCENVTNTECDEYVFGGEMSMWGETVDDSDMDQTIWPRSAAGAEKLWSLRNQTDHSSIPNDVHQRLEYFRCLLNTRGIAAAPTNNAQARQPPDGSDDCYGQRRRR